MMLKLKALIYKYLGVFLAHKEELEYIDSEEFWKQFRKIIKNPENDLGPRTIHGLLVGGWQAQHGFTRPMSRLRMFGYGNRFRNVISWCDELRITLIWDFESIVRKIKK